MSAEFNWWLLIVGIVAGGALTWLVLADSSRRDQDIADDELTAEAAWIARSAGQPVIDAETAERVLRAHRRYLGFPPPDTFVDPDTLVAIDEAYPLPPPPPPMVTAETPGTTGSPDRA